MRGTIKFVDKKTGKWGFIIPEGGGDDLHFYLSDCVGPPPTYMDASAPVELEIETDDQGRTHCRRVQLLVEPVPLPEWVPARGLYFSLTNWGWIPLGDSDEDGKTSALEVLADLALPETWHFGETPDPAHPWPLLDNYLRYTFVKLQREGNVLEASSTAGDYAVFNTGLVDRLFDPIYALFGSNPRHGMQRWAFIDFCVPGKGPSGKKLTAIFDPLPPAPSYFESNFDMLLDTSRDIHVDYEHVILDGIARDRFPDEFLRQNAPRRWEWQDYRTLPQPEVEDYLSRFAQALNDDVQALRGIRNRLDDAKVLAEKRTRWNFKTAIPQWYPKLDLMSLLLPLCLLDDNVVDIALVVSRNPSGSYQGRTVLTLPWAYKNARLVSRPDSDWLVPTAIPAEEDRPMHESDGTMTESA